MAGLFFFLFIVLVIGIIVGLVFVVKKRRQDMQEVARKLSMDFYPKGDERIAPMLANLEFFMYGSKCEVSNLMRGEVKRQGKIVSVAIFDYNYTICLHRSTEFSFNEDSISMESNNESETFCQTVLVFYDESLDLPGFSLRSEHLWLDLKILTLISFRFSRKSIDSYPTKSLMSVNCFNQISLNFMRTIWYALKQWDHMFWFSPLAVLAVKLQPSIIKPSVPVVI
jgi:hypothetical protein